MINTKNLLTKSVLSALLLTTTLSSQTMHCSGGKCYIDIHKLTPVRSTESKVNTFKTLTGSFSPAIETIIFDHSTYIMSNSEKEIFELNEHLIYNAEDIIVLAHSKYIMTEIEKEKFYEEERLQEIEIIEPIVQIEEKIIEESMLPTSNFYCEIPKKAEFHPESNSYECV